MDGSKSWFNGLRSAVQKYIIKILQGGTGKRGLASDMMLLYSASLLIRIKNEQRGKGAGTHVRLSKSKASTEES